ncbi:MAG: galactose mutarotase [Muribaculaceae bacterium]|nr:galactose mutarotase [Muribaculaceae bacterium]
MSIDRINTALGECELWTLENSKGERVILSSLGAGIVSVEVPDRMGELANVALRYANCADYFEDGPCMGKIPGRYANRIAGGKFTLDGKEYPLAVNNGPNHLHGGPTGFQNRLWKGEIIPGGVRFRYTSADGEEGYPGELKVTADYTWSDRSELTLQLSAVTSAPTVVNLTNHTYWNLDGADSGSVLEHKMRIKAHHWLPTDDTLVPLGMLTGVKGTPMSFLRTKMIGQDLRKDFAALKYGKGYDNCWALDGAPGEMVEDAVRLHSDKSGRTLTVSTDQPGVQIYTGNWLAGSPKNMSGRSYEDYDGVAIEVQGFPDAPNNPAFPSQRLNPGELYSRTIRFKFTTD